MKKIESTSISVLLVILITIIGVLIVLNVGKSLERQHKRGYDMAMADTEAWYDEGYNDAIHDFTYDWMPIVFCEAKQTDEYCEWLAQIRPKYSVSDDCLYYFQEKIFEEAMEIMK